jgi:hypothetical protein
MRALYFTDYGTCSEVSRLMFVKADLQIGVANRDYHYISHFEIGSAKRIYRHLIGRRAH